MSHSIHYFFQIMLIMNFSIIQYLKTFEMRTSGLYDNHYIVWGSHFRYHVIVITGGISFPNGGFVNIGKCRDKQPKWVLAGGQKPRKAREGLIVVTS